MALEKDDSGQASHFTIGALVRSVDTNRRVRILVPTLALEYRKGSERLSSWVGYDVTR